MKKAATLVLVLAMCSMILVGCGESTPKGPEDVKGEIYDTGIVSALVPEGWMAFPVQDMWDEYEDGHDPNGLKITKGAKTDFDLFSKPNITVSYFGDNTTMSPPSMDFYDDGKELEPFTTGDYTWHGYAAKSADALVIVLWTDEGPQLQVDIWPERPGGTFSLEDADVQAFLASIAIKK